MTDITEKKLMESQINKIFSILENSDNQEILKIALETLSNRCYENKSFLYIVLKNIIECARKGNLRVIQETQFLFDSVFEEFNSEYVHKLFNCPVFREQVENLLSADENIFSINLDSNFENIYSTDFVGSDELEKFKPDAIENLYSKKSDDESSNEDITNNNSNNSLPFSKGEMEILFPDKNEFSEEIVESLKSSRRECIQTKKVMSKLKMKISNFFLNKNSEILLNQYFQKSNGVKRRKLDNNFNNEIKNEDNNEEDLFIREILFNPMHFVIKELVDLNCQHNWRTRLCSISILNYLKDYLPDCYFSYYVVIISYKKSMNIEEFKIKQIKLDEIKDNSIYSNLSELSNKMRENLISRLMISAIIDKVVDFNSEDYICLFKEINIKFCINLLYNEDLNLKLNCKIVNLLEVFLDNYDNVDWQPIYSILIYIKNMLSEKECVNSKDQLKIKLFGIICKIMNIHSEEILNLTIQILDKMLEKKTIIHYINPDKLSSIFSNFLKLIDKYDDIEIGVKYYFSCLYNFIIYFKSTNEVKHFQQLIPIMENELIFFSLNKICCVRVKYFEVMNNLLDCKEFKVSPKFIEHNISLAFQGLCMEEDRNLLHVQKQFLEKMIMNDEYVDFFFKNSKIFLKLMLKKNIESLKYFYIPHSEKYDKSEMQLIYTGFFKNSMEIEAINTNYERKLSHLIPLFALIMRQKIEFTKILLNLLKIDINPNNCVISKELFIVLKTYFYYLESIEMSTNKVFIFNDELLKKLYDNTSLNETSFKFVRKEIEHFLLTFKIFLDFSHKIKHSEILPFHTNLATLYQNLSEKSLMKTNELLELLKTIFEKIKEPTNDGNFHIVCDNFRCFTNQITNLEKSTLPLKTKIRGLAAVCYFIHYLYSNVKIEKCSNIAHPILNCLKENNKETKIFARYLIKLLFTVNNLETVNKILFTFIDNSIAVYHEEVLEKCGNSELGNYKAFLPIKYFFKEFAKYERYNDISRIINEYKTNIFESSIVNIKANNISKCKEISCEKKIIILIYLLTFVNSKIKCIEFQQFYNIVKEKEKINDNPYIVKIISSILMNYEKIFSDLPCSDSQKENEACSINLILSSFFSDISLLYTGNRVEIIHFLFQIIEELLNNQKFLIYASGYLLDILRFINCKNKNLRATTISIFSKIMKTITLLKMDKDYEDIIPKTNSTMSGGNSSSSLISTLFNQKVDDKISCNFLNVNLKENLRSYQITGINWLIFLGNFNLGVALCDDMGLGKTIQTLVCIVNESKIYQQKNKKNPINLIVCPNTLMLNWVNEGKKFFHEKDVKIIRVENEFKFSQKKTSQIEILVTSYDRIRDYEIFDSVELFYLVLDEAHIVKNPKTKLYQSIRQLNSERRVILTGTPIQNNVMELWALFDFLMPGFLGDENDFEIKYHKKIHSNIKKLNLEEKLQENIFQTSLLEIRKRVKPFIMRRLKHDVLKELPDKIILDYVCEMTPVQSQLYSYWEKVYNCEKEETGKKKKTVSGNQNNTFKVIDCLRKICNYPGLLSKENMSGIPSLKKISQESLLNFYSSGKLKSLEDLLISLGFENSANPEITNTNSENKVLIFTQFKAMVEVLSQFLKFSFPSLNAMTITSDLSNEERIDNVNQFNSDPTITTLILTTSIGGLGLSLTSANIVIMYDHDWNPMRDLQAMDRAHRIGQKKTVEVFRLITADSIEEKLISLQTFKKYIANNVVDQTKIHETNINVNTFMESLEEFSSNKIGKKAKIEMKETRRKKININNINEDPNKMDEETELEYLKKFI